MRVTLKDGPFWTFVIETENGESRLIQSDWEFPSAAIAFGWSPCFCGYTDGTVDCNHKTTIQMIWEAFDFLDQNVGKIVQQ